MYDPSQQNGKQRSSPVPLIGPTAGDTPAPPELESCQAAALASTLVFKVDFGESLAFCDAAYPKEHELHEIIYWDSQKFQEEPGLFEAVMKKALIWNARFIYTVGKNLG